MISKVSARLKVGVALVATLSQLTAGPAAVFFGPDRHHDGKRL